MFTTHCSTTIVRVPALVSAALFAATAAVDIPHDQPSHFAGPLDYALELLFAAALLFAAVAGRNWACAQPSRAARVACQVAASGFGLLGVSAMSTAARGQDSLGLVFLLGLVLLLASAITLAVLDLRARLAPRWSGVTFGAGLVAMIALGDGYGVLAWSACWAGIAALSRPGRAVERPDREQVNA